MGFLRFQIDHNAAKFRAMTDFASSKNRLMLITGASAGIGAEFARQYAELGWDLAITARRLERLETLKAELEERFGIHVLPIAADLAKDGAVDEILGAIKAEGRFVDGIVNNAGYGLPGTFFNTEWSDQADFIRVLYTVPCELVHKCAASMAQRGYGRIINVASVAGYTPGTAGHSLYSSVKSALIKFSESVHAEAKSAGHNINCCALCPGFTWSEFHDVNGTREQTNKMPGWMWMEAEPVVRAGIKAVEKGAVVRVPGVPNKIITTLLRILPEPLGRALTAGNSKRFRREE